jgi:hypothetical protein
LFIKIIIKSIFENRDNKDKVYNVGVLKYNGVDQLYYTYFSMDKNYIKVILLQKNVFSKPKLKQKNTKYQKNEAIEHIKFFKNILNIRLLLRIR